MPAAAMKDCVLRFNDALYLGCIWVSGIAIVTMAAIIPWGIFTRYVLGTGSQWPEPIAIQLMVLFTFLGAAAAYRAGAHIAVALLTERLPALWRRPLRGLVHLLMLAVAMFVVVYGARLCLSTWGQVIGQLPWLPVGLTYVPLPLGGLLTACFVIEHMLFGPQHLRRVVAVDATPQDVAG
ncbi:TRAP transporter small permease [Calidifontimicrobium sp. SYSU G02091]|uniref:TRAP transporter small permease n=1 Tax=Calidifontimicrobium sp. SYSU G02091 TaxID=2926421 RepID=UPI001F534859|nr:TRAP transporter small permease [Calidifontimicrobium sp. SYSU G02091]MCI1193304.1 TRAP transporter small permease [Calidifontimicrobium sp. SYSU G02091]